MAGTSLDKPGHDSHRARRDRNAVSFNTVILRRHNVATCDEEADHAPNLRRGHGIQRRTAESLPAR